MPLGGGAALTDTRVLLDHGRVSIRSESAPLADILTRFAQATGAEVVYEAARPRQLVSVVIEAASPAEAIARLLEGQGLDYALRLDPTGRNVEMLILAGAASPAAAPAGPGRSLRASPPAFPPPEELDEVEPAEFDAPPAPEANEGPEPSASPGMLPGDLMIPAPGLPGAVPRAPAGAELSSPASPSGSVAPEPGQPQPPAVASYPGGVPGSPPLPSPPVYPGPASYPDRE
jgi:hypothetical protein